MKRLLLLLGCSAVLLGAADLAAVHAVYVMPMNRGLDQYLANRLINKHIFQVVTDPKLADAIFTDRIGEGFQTQLEDIFPDPNKEKAGDVVKAARHAESDDNGRVQPPTLRDTVNRLDNPALVSTFGRGRGTIFLVDAKSRVVVWSTFDPSRSNLNHDLDRTASDIVNRLKRDLTQKEPQEQKEK